MKWTFDLKPDDVFWCTADVGWVTGHSYVCYGPLAAGGTEIIFEGVPTYPDAGRFWKMIQDHKRLDLLHRADRDPLADQGRRRPAEAVRPVEPAHPRLGRRADQSGSLDVVLRDGRRRPLPDRRHVVADRDRRPHDHAAARRDAAEARQLHDAAARHRGRDRRRDRPRRRERQGRHPRHQEAVAVDDPHDLGRRRALPARATTPTTSAAATTSPATARTATSTATSGSWAASTTC